MMGKYFVRALTAAILAVVMAVNCGCSGKRDYGTEYNFETDCQYSYISAVNFWKKVQSDGAGQYILQGDYIYYHDNAKNTLIPLCNKPNCLHDKETDEDKRFDCNAFYDSFCSDNAYIQYNEGYIYYVLSNFMRSNPPTQSCTLYRVKADGSKKDAVFTTADNEKIDHWLLHRGVFYYEVLEDSPDSGGTNEKCMVKAVPVSNKMSEKNVKVIFASDDGVYDPSLMSQFRAYRNYLCYLVSGSTENAAGEREFFSNYYLYNTEIEQNRVIPLPEDLPDTVVVAQVAFLKDKMLLDLYDNGYDGDYRLPIYSINYDLTDEKIWLDNVEQDKWLQTYDDYVVISDGFLQWHHYLAQSSDEESTVSASDAVAEPTSCNVEIYSPDAKKISWFVYPRSEGWGNFNGFGPDGVNVEMVNEDDGWSVYEFSLEDVLHCSGEEITLDVVSTRPYEALHKDED